MASGRKRKLGTINAPSTDNLNELLIHHNNSFSLKEQDERSNTSDLHGFKVFNDPVHGHFELPSLLFKIIDTPQFQRLRQIKQLGGGVYLVFPGASHNRFEHSIGVAYLAGRMCKSLQKRQPELSITTIDCICVQIAGLCHDLGHGPFSHLFDGLFIPNAKPDVTWSHEDGSVDMFDHMVTENNLMPAFEKFGLNNTDLCFIKELIAGPKNKEDNSQKWQYAGRPEEKSYLYEIVANKRTGIDVDKWDYFARDCHHLGISNNFDYKRFIKFARVVSVDGKFQVCTRDKEVSTLYDMFHTRNSLHRRAYQHKTAKIIDIMVNDALLKANNHLTLPGKNGRMTTIADCIHDMFAYTHLTDNILSLIEISRDENLKESQQIIQRIHKRDLYKVIGQTILSKKVDKGDAHKLCDDIVKRIDTVAVNQEDFVVQILQLDYGMKDKNPIDQVRFYDKNKPDIARKVKKNQVSQMLPERFAEQHVRFYCKKGDQELIHHASKAFKDWCRSMSCSTADSDNPELTSASE